MKSYGYFGKTLMWYQMFYAGPGYFGVVVERKKYARGIPVGNSYLHFNSCYTLINKAIANTNDIVKLWEGTQPYVGYLGDAGYGNFLVLYRHDKKLSVKVITGGGTVLSSLDKIATGKSATCKVGSPSGTGKYLYIKVTVTYWSDKEERTTTIYIYPNQSFLPELKTRVNNDAAGAFLL